MLVRSLKKGRRRDLRHGKHKFCKVAGQESNNKVRVGFWKTNMSGKASSIICKFPYFQLLMVCIFSLIGAIVFFGQEKA